MNIDLPNTHLGTEQTVKSNYFFSQTYINTTVFWWGEGVCSENVQAGELLISLPLSKKDFMKDKGFWKALDAL